MERLSEDLALRILDWLDDPVDISHFASTCQRFHQLGVVPIPMRISNEQYRIPHILFIEKCNGHALTERTFSRLTTPSQPLPRYTASGSNNSHLFSLFRYDRANQQRAYFNRFARVAVRETNAEQDKVHFEPLFLLGAPEDHWQMVVPESPKKTSAQTRKRRNHISWTGTLYCVGNQRDASGLEKKCGITSDVTPQPLSIDTRGRTYVHRGKPPEVRNHISPTITLQSVHAVWKYSLEYWKRPTVTLPIVPKPLFSDDGWYILMDPSCFRNTMTRDHLRSVLNRGSPGNLFAHVPADISLRQGLYSIRTKALQFGYTLPVYQADQVLAHEPGYYRGFLRYLFRAHSCRWSVLLYFFALAADMQENPSIPVIPVEQALRWNPEHPDHQYIRHENNMVRIHVEGDTLDLEADGNGENSTNEPWEVVIVGGW